MSTKKFPPVLVFADDKMRDIFMSMFERSPLKSNGLEIVAVTLDEVTEYSSADVDATMQTALTLEALKPVPEIKINRNRNCPRCRTPLHWNAKFCSKCGAWAQ